MKSPMKVQMPFIFKLKFAGIAALATHCKELTVLNLACCQALLFCGIFLIQWQYISDRSMAKLGRHCTKLQVLKLDHLTGIHGQSFQTSVPKYLKCNSTKSFTILSWIYLKELSLKGCAKFTDHTFQYIPYFCRNLESIDMSGLIFSASLVQDFFLSYLKSWRPVASTKLPEGCTCLTDASVKMVTQHCPAIKHLDLSEVAITDFSLFFVST